MLTFFAMTSAISLIGVLVFCLFFWNISGNGVNVMTNDADDDDKQSIERVVYMPASLHFLSLSV